jgi:hypothetical protein
VTAWTSEALERIASAEELEIAPRRADGTLRRPVPIWVVRAGESLYIRSWRGAEGSWYRAAHTAARRPSSTSDSALAQRESPSRAGAFRAVGDGAVTVIVGG